MGDSRHHEGIMDALDSHLNKELQKYRGDNYGMSRFDVHASRRADQALRQAFENRVQAAFQEAFEDYVLWLASLRLEYMASLAVYGARQRQRTYLEGQEGERRRFIDSEESMSFLDITHRRQSVGEYLLRHASLRVHYQAVLADLRHRWEEATDLDQKERLLRVDPWWGGCLL